MNRLYSMLAWLKRCTAVVAALAVAAAALLSPMGAASQAASSPRFLDISGHWAQKAIEWAAEQGIVNGYPNGQFRPDQKVNEAEFLAMLFKAYPEVRLPAAGAAAPWYETYYLAAEGLGWPVIRDTQGDRFNRGAVARILAATQGRVLDTADAVQFLLDKKLANGKASGTVQGFGVNDELTRAEALTLISNALNQQVKLMKAENAGGGESVQSVPSDKEFTVHGLAMGDSEQKVLSLLGQPNRKDESEYGFIWYVYNQDYANYVQVGIQSGKVTALFAPSNDWSSKKGLVRGSDAAMLSELYGEPLKGLLKGSVMHMFSESQTEYVFLIDQAYTTVFVDQHNGSQVMAVYMIDKAVEDASGMDGPSSAAFRTAQERQIFDITNAFRVQFGQTPFQWDEAMAGTARKHSQDMAASGYFSHTNTRGQSPFDRMKADGISYALAAENIAAGQRNAIYAAAGWINSLGHRTNMLGKAQKLGVGVAFGGEMGIYYTQNFYTPLK